MPEPKSALIGIAAVKATEFTPIYYTMKIKTNVRNTALMMSMSLIGFNKPFVFASYPIGTKLDEADKKLKRLWENARNPKS